MHALFARAVSGDDRSDARSRQVRFPATSAHGASTLRALSSWKSLFRRPPTEDVLRRDLRHDRRGSNAIRPLRRRRDEHDAFVDRKPPGVRPVSWVRAHAPYAGTPFAVLPSSTSREAIEAGARAAVMPTRVPTHPFVVGSDSRAVRRHGRATFTTRPCTRRGPRSGCDPEVRPGAPPKRSLASGNRPCSPPAFTDVDTDRPEVRATSVYHRHPSRRAPKRSDHDPYATYLATWDDAPTPSRRRRRVHGVLHGTPMRFRAGTVVGRPPWHALLGVRSGVFFPKA